MSRIRFPRSTAMFGCWMLLLALVSVGLSAQATSADTSTPVRATPAKAPPGQPSPAVETRDGSCGYLPEQRVAELKSGSSHDDLMFIFIGGANDGSHSVLPGPLGTAPNKRVFSAVCGDQPGAFRKVHPGWLIAYFEYPQASAILRFMKAYPFRVVLIGHSYGADTAAYITVACNMRKVQPIIDQARAEAQFKRKDEAAKAKTAIDSIFGHALATSCTDQQISGLITIDPVSQLAGKDDTYLELYYKAVRSSTPFWIDVNATPTRPNKSDTVATLGGKWGTTVGRIPDYGASNANHEQFHEMMRDERIGFAETSALTRTCHSLTVEEFLQHLIEQHGAVGCRDVPPTAPSVELTGTWTATITFIERQANPFGGGLSAAKGRVASISEPRTTATFTRTATGYTVAILGTVKRSLPNANILVNLDIQLDLLPAPEELPAQLRSGITPAVWITSNLNNRSDGNLDPYFTCPLPQGLSFIPAAQQINLLPAYGVSPSLNTGELRTVVQGPQLVQQCGAWMEFNFKK